MAILEKSSIMVGCTGYTKEAVIKKMGELMVAGGYATEKYTEAMMKKEEMVNTFIGNKVALPHGIETMKSEILKSGMAIMTFPDGVDWGNGQTINLAVCVAAVGDEHMDVLTKVALNCMSEADTDKVVASSLDEIYNLFAM